MATLAGPPSPAEATDGLPTGGNVFPSSCVGELWQTRFAVNEPICINGRVSPSPQVPISGDSTMHIVPVEAGPNPSAAVASRRIVLLGTFIDEPIWLRPTTGEYYLVVDNWSTGEFSPGEGDYVYHERLVVDGERLGTYHFDASAIKAQAGADRDRVRSQARGVKAGLYSTAIASLFSIGMNFHLAGLTRFGFGYRFAGWAGVAGLGAFASRALPFIPGIPLYMGYDGAVMAIGARIIFGIYDAKIESYEQLHNDPADPDYQRMDGPDLRAIEAHAAQVLADDPLLTQAGVDVTLPQAPAIDHPLAIGNAELANLTADQAALIRAFMHSNERFLGARDADDLAWAVAHGNALIDHAEALEDSYRRSQAVLADLADDYERFSDGDGPTSGDELAAIQDELSDGFDAEQRRNLRLSGYTEADREVLLAEILAVDPAEVGDGETLPSMYRDRRDALEMSIAAFAEAADDMRDLLAQLDADFDDPNVPVVEVMATDDPAPGRSVTVAAQASGGEGDLSFAWDLTGDGRFDDASGASADVTFDTAGPHPVAVRTTDERGIAAVGRTSVEVVAAPPATLTGTPEDTPLQAAPGDELTFTVDDAPSGAQVGWTVDGEPAGTGTSVEFDVPRRPGALLVVAEASDGDRVVGAAGWVVLIDDDLDGADALTIDLAQTEVEAGEGLAPVTVQLVDADGAPVARADEPVVLELVRTDGAVLPPGSGLDGTVESVTDASGSATFDPLSLRTLTPSGEYHLRATHGEDRVAAATSNALAVTPPTTTPADVDITLAGLGGVVPPGAQLDGTLRVDIDDPDGTLDDGVSVDLDLRDPALGPLDDPASSVAGDLLDSFEVAPDLLGGSRPLAEVDGVGMAVTAGVHADAPDVDAVWVALVRDADGRLVTARTVHLAVREPLPGDPGASATLTGLPERLEPGEPMSFSLELSLDAPGETQGDVLVELTGPEPLGDGDAAASFQAPVFDPDDLVGVPTDPAAFGGEAIVVDVTVDVAADAVPGGYVWGVTLSDDRGILAADQAAGQVPRPPLQRPEASATLATTTPVDQGADTTFDLTVGLTDPDGVVEDDLTLHLDLRDAAGDDLLDPATSVLDDVVDTLVTAPDVLTDPLAPATLRDGVEATATATTADDALVGSFWWVLEVHDTDGQVVAAAATPQSIDGAPSPTVTFVTSGLDDTFVPDQEASFQVEVAGSDPAGRLPTEIDLSWDVRSDADDPETSLVGELFQRVSLSPDGFFDAPVLTDRVVADGRRVRFDVRMAFDAPSSDLDGYPLVLEAHAPDGRLIARSTADSLLVGDDARLPGTGGPVILTGIDPELGPGDCYHGCLSTWQDVLAGVLERTRNAGSGVLVIGANSGQAVQWWTRIVEGYDPQGLPGLGVRLDFVDAPADIAAVDLGEYAMIGVATSTFQLSSGGITSAQNEALNARAADIATFINRGGGVLGHTQDRLPNPYAYISGVGQIVQSTGASNVLQITEAGFDAGIRQDFEGCCWHTSFAEWPDFMEPLVYGAPGSRDYVQVLGGRQVGIATGIELSPIRAEALAGDTIELHALVEEDEQPVEGVEVTFTVADGGPHEGTVLTADTGQDGTATVSITGVSIGEDTVEASYLDSNDDERVSNRATLRWRPIDSEVTFDPATATLGVGDTHTVTATIVEGGEPAGGREVTFEVVGVNEDVTAPTTVETDEHGVATFSYVGQHVGDDVVEVTATDGMGKVWLDELEVDWQLREMCTELIAAQHHDAGQVCVRLDGDDLTVTYETDGGWRLLRTHLAVATDLDAYVDLRWTNPSGNPAIGRFPHQGTHDAEQQVTFRIATDDIAGFTSADELIVAAHAVVVDPGSGSEETAWGAGTRFVEGGSWATYFAFQLSGP